MSEDVLLWQRGNAQAAQRDWPRAIVSFRALADRQPGSAAPWIALAKALDAAGQVREAHAAAIRAATAGPADWRHAMALARLLRHHHAVRELASLAAAMPAWSGAATTAELVELADLLGQADLHDEALPWLELAISRDAGSAPAFYLRGTTRLFRGEMARAGQDLEQAIALAPHFAHAHWRLTELRAQRSDDRESRVARLLAARAQAVAGSEHDIHFSFSLHAELHGLGRYDEAWAALERGCRAKRAALRYDLGADLRLMDALQAGAGAGPAEAPAHRTEAPVPVFIVGLFRSGTTLLERLLAGHSGIADGGETLGFTAALRRAVDYRSRSLLDEETLRRAAGIDFAALGADFMAGSSWRARGRAAWTEKLPSNFLNLGLIARALPQARFLHMIRPPRDVCFSNLRTLYGGICPYSYDQAEMAGYHAAYRRLMAHWRTALGDRLLDVPHAALVREPAAVMQQVLAHCGLAYEPGVLAFGQRTGVVSTASAAQVRDGIRAPGAPEWTPYEDRLQPLFRALAEAGADA